MTTYPKRLIEVDLPIKRISAHARREKSIRHGHISTLHIWWARRPLAACRAVICASLWPDPVDDLCPVAFTEVARERMFDWARDHLRLASAESASRMVAIQKDPALLDDPLTLRRALLDFIADFANWDNSAVREYLETSRALTQAAHEALGGVPGTRPLVVDPFAGGGAIPLEALRVGADAFASDLNPVAVLLNKVVLEYIPKYGQRLADEVRKWGDWIKQEAEKELAEFYPKDPDGATPIAYLWARTIQCEGPGCGAEVPLIRSLWLAKKSSGSVALQLVPQSQVKQVGLRIVTRQPDGWMDQTNQGIRIENPKFDGTVKRGSVTCPICGYTTPVAKVRTQLKKRLGGTRDARLMCVVVTRQEAQGRFYRLPDVRDIDAVTKASVVLQNRLDNHQGTLSLIPDEEFTGLEPRRIPLPLYGIDGFAEMFNSRQMLALVTLTDLIARLRQQDDFAIDPQLQTAIQTLLALAVDKQADLGNSLCPWEPNAQCPRHMFSKQAMNMVWDFAEGVVTGDSSGSWSIQIERSERILSDIDANWLSGQVWQASALNHPLPDDSADAMITDPPYYFSVPYSDLADFFYVWLRRSLASVHPDLFASHLTPKQDECVQNLPHAEVAARQKDRHFYESSMCRALTEARRIAKPDSIGTVVFAHSETDAWESLLKALISAGWVVTASWPLDTEMATRIVAQRQVTLASSIHLVCRPRKEGVTGASLIGDWRDILAELPIRIHDWMPRLAEEGVVGADAIFACLGPALEIFSRYAHVEKASGEVVTLKEYLEQVWAAVAKEALSLVFAGADTASFEPDARLTAMWLWTLNAGANTDALTQNELFSDEPDDEESTVKTKTKLKGGFTLEYDAARKIAQGLGAHLEELPHLVEIKGDQAPIAPRRRAHQTPFRQGRGTSPNPRTRQEKARAGRSVRRSQRSRGRGWLGRCGRTQGRRDRARPHSPKHDPVRRRSRRSPQAVFRRGRRWPRSAFLGTGPGTLRALSVPDRGKTLGRWGVGPQEIVGAVSPLKAISVENDMTTLTIDMPQGAFSALRRSPPELAIEIRIAAAVQWYAEQVISQEKAAEIAGLSRTEFLDELRRRKVSAFQETFEDLVREIDGE